MKLKKIREKGIVWFLARLKYELRTPTNQKVKSFIDGLLMFKKKISRKKKNNEYLYAIYDLEIAPITFNIIEFLIDAEYEANRLGKTGFVVIFVPKKENSSNVWEEYDSVIDEDNKSWRFENIVLPITRMSEKCKGTYVLPNRLEVIKIVENTEVYPHLYDGVNLRYIDIANFYKKMDQPGLVTGLKANLKGLQYINEWIKEKNITQPIITISLRQYGFDPDRNSNVEEWKKFSKYLKGSGYIPVIIPDNDKSFDIEKSFEDSFVFKECSWNLGLRMALYELAFLNFFVAQGPLDLAVWNENCSYIAMNFLPEKTLISTEEAHNAIGYKRGDHFKFALPNQRLIYLPDTYENILNVFKDFVKDNN